MSHHHLNPPITQTQPQPTPAHAASPVAAHAGCCSVIAAPTHDDIAKRAYDIYLKTGRKQGQCKQNWQQAELSLSRQAARPPQDRSPGTFAVHAAGAR